jgi:uncharacterized protein
MPSVQVIASRPLSGKTTIAVALAQGLARNAAVRLVRLGSSDAAEQDAVSFADYLFAGSTGRPMTVEQLQPAAANEIVVLESDARTSLNNVPAILVTRGAPTDDDIAVAQGLGQRLIGTIATGVVPSQVEAVARDLTNANLRPLAVIPEDRMLAAPSVSELRTALNGSVLFEAENDNEVVEDVLIAPVYADPARPHFRRFQSKAVLSPFNKTDLHLAAIESQAACLVITGGHDPSPYVYDRAQHGTTTVLLTDQETPETLSALSEVWLTSRFRGQRKADAIFAHLDGRMDFVALARKLEA